MLIIVFMDLVNITLMTFQWFKGKVITNGHLEGKKKCKKVLTLDFDTPRAFYQNCIKSAKKL